MGLLVGYFNVLVVCVGVGWGALDCEAILHSGLMGQNEIFTGR